MAYQEDVERRIRRTQEIKDRLEKELAGHCEPLRRSGFDPWVHTFRVDDDRGRPSYLLTVLEETLEDLGIPEPTDLIDDQDTIARMREAGMTGVRLRHPVLDPQG